MLAQAAGLAVLAALSPTALLIAAVYLGSAQPRRTTLFYLAGALVSTVILGVVVLILLRVGGFSRPGNHTPRYGLRLGLGILILAVGAVIARRKPKPPDPNRPQKGLVSKLIANPSPYTAFLAGVLIFAPGVTFIAAVQVVATSRASNALTAVGLALVIIIDVAFVWLPLLAHVIAPEATSRRLGAFNGWLRSHGRTILIGVLLVAGVIVTVDGLSGLITKG
ncbi:MAG TPA: GAP family protein [Streptosporangiaceae bacterium]|jgi:hypothetical protein|nr:GAP family protein [Streptosporangiaceae bacterium]